MFFFLEKYRFVVKIPEGLSPEQAAPLLCAGVTVYSPLSHFGLKKNGLKGAIVGLGGVGHMGVLIAKAMGHHVTIISSSDKKRDEAMNVLGANEYFVSSDTAKIQAAVDSFDYIIDTVPANHPLDEYLSLLKLDGKLILLGVINTPLQFISPLLMGGKFSVNIIYPGNTLCRQCLNCVYMICFEGRKTITGTFIGSMKEIEELLEFCKEKDVKSTVEIVKMDYINTAMERVAKNDVRYRFVVDVAGSKLEDE